MNTSARKQFVALLHDVARQIQAMDSEQFDKVLAGELKLEVQVSRESQTKKRERKKQVSIEELEQLRSALRKTDTREQARELIDSVLHTKEEFFQLARILDVPVPKKSAPIDHLKDRLVEATVGFRIQSAAVQGKLETLMGPMGQVK